jgi:hypothetical protein
VTVSPWVAGPLVEEAGAAVVTCVFRPRQVAPCCGRPDQGTAGNFDFFNIVMESSATPLLDIQLDPAVTSFGGLEAITIIDFLNADSKVTTYADVQNLNAVVQLNCSAPDCALDGVTIIGASADGSPYNHYKVGHAVRVFAGDVRSVTVLDSSHAGAVDVVDSRGVPFGSYMTKTEGGLMLVGENRSTADASMLTTTDAQQGHAGGRSSPHGLLFGLSGETTGRLALDTDGSLCWGAGQGRDFDTTLHRALTNATQWDPPPLGGSRARRTKLRMPLAGVRQGDLVSVSHSGLDGELDTVLLSAVASTDAVVVVLRYTGDANEPAADVPPGVVRVVVTKWSGAASPGPPPPTPGPPPPGPPTPPPPPTTPRLVFHAPSAADSGAGWGDTLHTLFQADRWNETVVFSFGNHNTVMRKGFVAVSKTGGSSWDYGSLPGDPGNWSHDLCPTDDNFPTAIVTANGMLHTFGSARGSGATVGTYSSWNSSQVSFVHSVPGAAVAASAKAQCESRMVTFRGLPVPVYCNHTGTTADCFWTNSGGSVRLADGSWLTTTAVPWLGGEFGPSADASGVFVFRSLDSFVWSYLSTVATAAEFPKSGEGPNENAIALTNRPCSSSSSSTTTTTTVKCDSLVVIMRMDGNGE